MMDDFERELITHYAMVRTSHLIAKLVRESARVAAQSHEVSAWQALNDVADSIERGTDKWLDDVMRTSLEAVEAHRADHP
jgi:hypothetical protein